MKTISEAQIEDKQLKRLAAQRQLYRESKLAQILQFVVSAPLSMVVAFFALSFPAFQNWASAWVLSLFAVFGLSSWESRLRQKAAKIQELFDCDVLQMEWNRFACDKLPDDDDIIVYSKRYLKREKDFKAFTEPPWYESSTDDLPMSVGRIMCQRENVSWEARSRKRYARIIATFAISVVTVGIIVAFFSRLHMMDFVMRILLPLSPLFVWSLKTYTANSRASRGMANIQEQILALLKNVKDGQISEEDLQNSSRSLQTEIYHKRCETPAVLDWIYGMFRDKDEMLEREKAESIVGEISKRFLQK